MRVVRRRYASRMGRRTKATQNRDKAVRLNEAWGVGAAQVRYSDDGHWHATLARFPGALFDTHGYVLFATEAEYRTAPRLSIGKQISVPQPGISAIPGYVRGVGVKPLHVAHVNLPLRAAAG